MALVGAFFHVGIVVPELEPAMAHLTDVLGLSWGRVVEFPAYAVRDVMYTVRARYQMRAAAFLPMPATVLPLQVGDVGPVPGFEPSASR